MLIVGATNWTFSNYKDLLKFPYFFQWGKNCLQFVSNFLPLLVAAISTDLHMYLDNSYLPRVAWLINCLHNVSHICHLIRNMKTHTRARTRTRTHTHTHKRTKANTLKPHKKCIHNPNLYSFSICITSYILYRHINIR